MPTVLYGFALAAVFTAAIAAMMQAHRQTRDFVQTLEEIQAAGIGFIGAHCSALPDAVTVAGLQAAGHLAPGFDDQGVAFTWRLADHPVVSVNASANVSVNARGGAGYLAFLGRHTLGGFEADASYTFIPELDATLFRAANNGYNLFAYAGHDFSCSTP